MNTIQTQTHDTDGKALAMWGEMDASERAGVSFGLFPHAKILAAQDEGYNGHGLTVALMNVAKKKRGLG